MLAHNLGHGVGNVDLVEVAVGDANAVALDDPRRDADGGAVWRNFFENDSVRGDFRVIADFERTENSRSRAYENVVSEGRVTLADVFSRAAERYVLIKCAVVADFGCFADNDARAVVDEQTFSDFRSGVNFNAGFVTRALRNPSCDEIVTALVKPVGATIAANRLVGRVEEDNLPARAHSGVASFYGRNFFFNLVKHSFSKKNKSPRTNGTKALTNAVPLRFGSGFAKRLPSFFLNAENGSAFPRTG